jgi:signal transduction histidine kinase
VICHSQQIQQVVMNLLTNARDALNAKYPAGHEDKIIRMTALEYEIDHSNCVRLTVEDHGQGICEVEKDVVFDPFYTTKRPGRGVGLGLSISHSIVKDHGGWLSVESKPGEWTRFHMDLPTAEICRNGVGRISL